MFLHPTPSRPWRRFARRFLGLFLGIYALVSIGLWIGGSAMLELLGPVTEYTISISLIIAVAFAGLYTAASWLRQAFRPSVAET